MFSLRNLLNCPYGFYEYIWVDVILIRETQKALLIEFDGRQAWLPKAWIVKIKSPLPAGERDRVRGKVVSIKISLYHWSKKYA